MSSKTKRQQTTSTILMVRPANFGFNEQTAANNAFQVRETNLTKKQIQQKAIEEFDTFVDKLRKKGVDVIVAKDSAKPVKPDAVFPNNWVSFHQEGSLITYPMYAPLRRTERQAHIIKLIEDSFEVTTKIALEDYEKADVFLEGTGSMILDRVNKIAYACLSPRTHDLLLKRYCELTGYKRVAFHSVDEKNQDIYHTNVMMAMGESFVVICMDTIKSKTERNRLIKKFESTKKAIIDISLKQMNAFAGNMLQVKNKKGKTFLVMSTQAFKSLTTQQKATIKKHTAIIHSSLEVIEQFGGGSARCMMAEVFLPTK